MQKTIIVIKATTNNRLFKYYKDYIVQLRFKMNIVLVIHKKTQNIIVQYMNKMNKGCVIVPKFNKIHSVARKSRVKSFFLLADVCRVDFQEVFRITCLLYKVRIASAAFEIKLFLHVECRAVCCVNLQVALSKMQILRCVLMLRVHVLYLVLYFAVLARDRISMYQDLEQCFV